MEIFPIAHIRTDFPQKFGLPRQSGLIPELKGKIIFEPEFRNADSLRGLDGFSHIWVIWEFSEGFASKSESVTNGFTPTVRPPRLGGNRRIGIFATRSPNRPNRLAMSCLKIEKIELSTPEGPCIIVSGIDMIDMTPIYDIKPYLPNIDSVPDAEGGFAYEVKDNNISVVIPDTYRESLDENFIISAEKILSEDPRPHYQDDGREYSLTYSGYNISFTALDNVITVTDISKI